MPPELAMSNPSATLPSVLKSVPQEKVPLDQVSFPVVASQVERPEPKSLDEDA